MKIDFFFPYLRLLQNCKRRISRDGTVYNSKGLQQRGLIAQNKLNIKTHSMAVTSYFSFYRVTPEVPPNLTGL